MVPGFGKYNIALELPCSVGERDGTIRATNSIRTYYDPNLHASGIVPVIPGTRSRKRPIRHDKLRYKDRWRAEAVFCHLKDFRRVATRYDKLARNYASTVAFAAVVTFWC